MHENDISGRVIGCAIEVHRQLGPGLLESVYEEALCYELTQSGLSYKRQQQVPISYKSLSLATPLRLDLIIEEKLILEIKAKEEITPIDKQQLLTYLRLCDVSLGLLINFNVTKLVNGITRVVNGLLETKIPEKTLSGPPPL
ncbi:MAG: GxxExxY protein [Planctomycetes bacterium]|nr:GxxExxY protein [Planctomycetota bacterium]